MSIRSAYHCFWVDGQHHRHHESFTQIEPVLALVKADRDGDSYIVSGLKVIWGEELEFEPAIVVESYKVKEAGNS